MALGAVDTHSTFTTLLLEKNHLTKCVLKYQK